MREPDWACLVGGGKPSSVNILNIHLRAENNRDNGNRKDQSLEKDPAPLPL